MSIFVVNEAFDVESKKRITDFNRVRFKVGTTKNAIAATLSIFRFPSSDNNNNNDDENSDNNNNNNNNKLSSANVNSKFRLSLPNFPISVSASLVRVYPHIIAQNANNCKDGGCGNCCEKCFDPPEDYSTEECSSPSSSDDLEEYFDAKKDTESSAALSCERNETLTHRDVSEQRREEDREKTVGEEKERRDEREEDHKAYKNSDFEEDDVNDAVKEYGTYVDYERPRLFYGANHIVVKNDGSPKTHHAIEGYKPISICFDTPDIVSIAHYTNLKKRKRYQMDKTEREEKPKTKARMSKRRKQYEGMHDFIIYKTRPSPLPSCSFNTTTTTTMTTTT